MKNKIIIGVMSVLLFGTFLWCILKDTDEFSYTERRELAKFPEVSVENIFGSGGENFMSEFEDYAADQFPMRDRFRTLNSMFRLYILQEKEMNDIYIVRDAATKENYAAKLDTVIDEKSVEWALDRFETIRERCLTESNVYLSIIPDKNYYLADSYGYPTLDYDRFFELFREGTAEYATYIDLTELLSIQNYYHTDTHWRQETLQPVAEHLLSAMQAEYQKDYEIETLDEDFYGVYYGQAALPMEPDVIRYASGGFLDEFTAYDHESGTPEEIPIYDMQKAHGRDPYEMFLCGSKSLITVERRERTTGRELVVFRDSFGSSITPLLACGYDKVTLVDIRYISPMMIGNFVDCEGADVLFLYSTQVLNTSTSQFIS